MSAVLAKTPLKCVLPQVLRALIVHKHPFGDSFTSIFQDATFDSVWSRPLLYDHSRDNGASTLPYHIAKRFGCQQMTMDMAAAYIQAVWRGKCVRSSRHVGNAYDGVNSALGVATFYERARFTDWEDGGRVGASPREWVRAVKQRV